MPAVRKPAEDQEPDPKNHNSKRAARIQPTVEPEALPGGDPAAGDPSASASGAGHHNPAAKEPTTLEVSRLMAQSQRRHDLEMRLAVLAIEYDRAIGSLQTLIKRYDDIRAECEAAQPPIHIQSLVPTILRTALKLARRQVRAEYPELKSLARRS